MQETSAPPMGREDSLWEGMTTNSSILCLENPMDRGAWQATVYRVVKTWTQLSDSHTHSATLQPVTQANTKEFSSNFELCHFEFNCNRLFLSEAASVFLSGKAESLYIIHPFKNPAASPLWRVFSNWSLDAAGRKHSEGP